MLASSPFTYENPATGLTFTTFFNSSTGTHILAFRGADDPSRNTMNTNELLDLLSDRPAVSFSGHMHKTEHHYLLKPDGNEHHHHVITALSGSWWSEPYQTDGEPAAVSSDGTPNGSHILSIDGSRYSTGFVPSKNDTIARAIVKGNSEGTNACDCYMIKIARIAKDNMNLYVKCL